MRTILMCSLLCVALAGCRLPPDHEPFKPLPENGATYSYGELLARLHVQANAAMDAFFVDAWVELDEAAQGMEQTVRFLAKTNDPPEHLKKTMVSSCANLQKDAARLGAAAQKKNAAAATEALQHITLQIRQLKGKE